MSIAYEKPQEQSEEHDGKARKTDPRHEFDAAIANPRCLPLSINDRRLRHYLYCSR